MFNAEKVHECKYVIVLDTCLDKEANKLHVCGTEVHRALGVFKDPTKPLTLYIL